jgi:hypothetical protein
MHIRQLIREILLEDYESWTDDTKKRGTTYYDVQTADMPSKERAKGPRDVKRMWNQHADHKFFDSLTKVHWLSQYLIDLQRKDPVKMIKSIVGASGKDEISTMGYLVNTMVKSGWGEYGVIISGRVTLAANDMDALLTGEHPGNYATARKKWKSSGLPRRASNFSPAMASNYILDSDSFDEYEQDHNELVVDNWKATGFVIPYEINRAHSDLTAGDRQILKAMKTIGLPTYDNKMGQVDLNIILADYQ